SLREEIVYHVVDKLLAEQVKEKGYKIINDSIKKTAIEKTNGPWIVMDKVDGYE
ncbi:MAG: hypothetical protein GY760_25245, partial [Deltaproteobacteria bacterium]|nr:hypothetical protein [Deltaproteobacteria bacterium]